MAKISNQKLKMLYLLKMLLERTDDSHALTLSQISDELYSLGISSERKSLYGDFEALKAFGLDIEKKRTSSVGYYIANRDFELPELKLLVDAVQSSKFITRKKSEELIAKIEKLTSKYEAQKLRRQVFVANRVKTVNETIYYTVDSIHTAINENKKITFKYYDWNEKKEKHLRRDGSLYKVSPWALTWDDENYYLIAYDSDAKITKHYRVDKMLELSVVNEKREGTNELADMDMALYSKKTFGMFGGDDEYIRLLCKNSMAGVIIDRFGNDQIFVPDGEEHFRTTVKAAVSPPFVSWLMNFGEDIKVLAPQCVIDRVKETAQLTLDMYK